MPGRLDTGPRAGRRRRVALRRQRPGWSRRKFQRHRKEFLRRNALLLASVGLPAAGWVWALHFLVHGYVLGLVQGACGASAVYAVALLQIGVSGSLGALVGAWGEDNTRDVLRAARRRRRIHGSVDNIEIEGGDIDHLVATGAGWLAIDSKWHASAVSTKALVEDVASARRAARRAQSVLRSIKRPTVVTPLVVVWGGLQHEIPGGRTVIDGVVVLAGRRLGSFLKDLPRDTRARSDASSALGELRAFRARVRPPDRPGGPTRSRTRSTRSGE